MRIFKTPQHDALETRREMKEMAIENQSYSSQDIIVKDDPGYKTKELIGYAYKITPSWEEKDLMEVLDDFDIPREWVAAEFIERTNGEQANPGEAWKKRADVWDRFREEDGRFSYTYGERYFPQLNTILEELKNHPTSRQAILQMYQERDNQWWGGAHRIPCTLSYQFFCRDGKVHCVYNMRSCDYFTFFASDMVLTLLLLRWVAQNLNLSVGTFTHFIGSLHAYQKDIDKHKIF